MAYVPGTALLAALVVGCSASTGTGGSAPDSKPGEATVAAAAPGKYRTLPDPCRAVVPSTLKELLPGAAELPEDQQKKVFEGTATVTYDTDRRVGCRWKSEAPVSSHTLFIDFERVVSYDPSVSDDDRAREVYTKKQTAAGLTSDSATPSSTKDAEKQTLPASDSTSDSASDSASHALSGPASEDKNTDGNADEPAGESSDENGGEGSEGSDTDGGTDGSAGSADESLLPRTLDDLGDGAFLDDLLTRAGSAAQNRTVSVVFRTSNVIVTVEYTEQPSVSTVVPDSKELQDKAQSLARKLVDKFSE
ncbi:DUF3558 domain-containing protein [Streptomyces sp. NPDC048473]|uniref:DUF3558 domain-containing protein n=1 Tax=unclassified Streptomyces TaxID=2593676 RepID=UPI00371450F8